MLLFPINSLLSNEVVLDDWKSLDHDDKRDQVLDGIEDVI